MSRPLFAMVVLGLTSLTQAEDFSAVIKPDRTEKRLIAEAEKIQEKLVMDHALVRALEGDCGPVRRVPLACAAIRDVNYRIEANEAKVRIIYAEIYERKPPGSY